MTSIPPSNDGEMNDTPAYAEDRKEIGMEELHEGGEEISSLPQDETNKSPAETPRQESLDCKGDTEAAAPEPKSARTPLTATTKRLAAPKSPRLRSAIGKSGNSSSIPLPVSKSIKTPSPSKVTPGSTPLRTGLAKSTKSIPGSGKCAGKDGLNKQALEVQFKAKKKKLAQMQKELLEKQKPVVELYQTLNDIKKKLEDLGKDVTMDGVKFSPFLIGETARPKTPTGAGESVPSTVVVELQSSIEEIPKTLTEICRNLLNRRNVIVELLENVCKSAVNGNDLADQIETLKTEGVNLRSHLDVVINEHHNKIKEIIQHWNALLSQRMSANGLEEDEDGDAMSKALYEESKGIILDLQRKLDEKKNGHEQCVNELNNVISGLKEQIQKFEHDLEIERKNALDFKHRNTSNSQMIKSLRNKFSELENEKKATDATNTELLKKIKHLEDKMKHQESQWTKDKEELTKNIKHQESAMQKLVSEKSNFEARLGDCKNQSVTVKDSLRSEIKRLQVEMEDLRGQLDAVTVERDEVRQRCKEMSDHISELGRENKQTMDIVSNSIQWGRGGPEASLKADEYTKDLMKDIIIQECTDKIKQLEEENAEQKEILTILQRKELSKETEREKKMIVNQDVVAKYKQLLAESERKICEKSQEVAKLTSEMRQLKVRQEHLEELNQKCPTENLQKMVEEGRSKLTELMKKSLDSEQKILHCESIIDKQSKQVNEMENLLRYRENMAGVLKTDRDQLVIEKESLNRYSHELRTVLAEVTKESRMKDRLVKELRDKIDLRERQISKMDKEIRDLENNLVLTNEKRFKLQETIGTMEKELQYTKAHVNQLADINTRYDIVEDSNSLNRSNMSLYHPLVQTGSSQMKIKITLG
ncbi:unnamed protein product [Phyllotreta striolata]|uniref:Uncharacterized protein n=1 Tax=Phyllotreta striolata TaxID=444603 RepID=A0A9N9TEF2_PHYSR|nr:unnamed protein product [Phyllotreta striolata]